MHCPPAVQFSAVLLLDAPATDVAGAGRQQMLLVLAASNLTNKNATTETGLL
jgi:hypothetical protein